MDKYSTTGGDYLETLFTHREIFSAYPHAHLHCARALSDIATAIERREWRCDRDDDYEAVAAFRHEAQSVSQTLYVPHLRENLVMYSNELLSDIHPTGRMPSIHRQPVL
jgi:hypothetical protein